ncbi:hypothetical protein [Hanstruepera neustonica]|nr:hypothetical protein [Hanstruepera neustonica]
MSKIFYFLARFQYRLTKTNSMKHLALFITILFASSSFAQDSTQVETPIIVTKLQFGKQLISKNISVEFKDVINDSRCPKNVNCVRAGEAKVLVAIYDGHEFIEEKVIQITPTTYLMNELPVLISDDRIIVKGFNLMPYPIFGEKIKKEDYTLQLVVED